jgi:ABC-type transport system substrate-binding protein
MRSGDIQVAWALLRFTDAETSLENYLRTGGAQNYVGYSNARMDEALDTFRRSQAEEERASALARIQALLIEDLPRFLVDRLVVWNISTPRCRGWRSSPMLVPRWDLVWMAR